MLCHHLGFGRDYALGCAVAKDWTPITYKDAHSGAMVALVPSSSLARRLTEYIPDWPAGSEPIPAEEMHITLAYLGETDQLPYTPDHVLAVLSDWYAHCAQPITGRVSGIGRFAETDAEGRNPVYASFDAPGLPKLRQSLIECLQAAKIQVSMEHGFQPHLTLAYVPSDAPTPTTGIAIIDDVTMPAVVLAWQDQRTSLLLPTQAQVHPHPDEYKEAKKDAPEPSNAPDPNLLYAEHPAPAHPVPTAASENPVALVEANLTEAQKLYKRLVARKELNQTIASAIYAAATRRLSR